MAVGDVSTIYLALLDEGIDVWRPVQATELASGLYQIVSDNVDPSDERWEFSAGSKVRCELRSLSGGTYLVAVEQMP